MAFNSIKGQARAVEFIRRSIRKGKPAHAYLFLGPRGSGKLAAAMELARALNCELRDQNAGEACGECLACRKISQGVHPDVRLVQPEGRGDRIRIETVRDLQREIAFKPYEGRKKVWIINEAASMTEEAANCLLKTLEEPPADSHLVLISTSSDQLLPTVVSRCQQVIFSRLKEEKLREILAEKYGVDPRLAHFLAYFSGGGMERALELRDRSFGCSLEEKNRLLDGFISSGPDRERLVETLAGCPREEVVQALELVLSWFRDVLVLKAGGETLINIDRKEDLRQEGERLNFHRLLGIIETVGETRRFIQAYANPKLALSVLADKL